MFSNDTTIVDLLVETFIRMFPVRCASDVMYMELFLVSLPHSTFFRHTAIVDLHMERTI